MPRLVTIRARRRSNIWKQSVAISAFHPRHYFLREEGDDPVEYTFTTHMMFSEVLYITIQCCKIHLEIMSS